MKRLNKIALSVVAVVAVGIGFSGCDIADDGKSPLIEIKPHQKDWTWINLQSRDDDTIINKMIISGRNGKCKINNLGAGGNNIIFTFVKYGEKIPYDSSRMVIFDRESCPPKNGKYEIDIKTNFGTYYYEIGK